MPRTVAVTRRAAISGDIVISKISGEAVRISGDQVVVASGAYLASGIHVVIPAVPVTVSGQPIWVHSGVINVLSGVVRALTSGDIHRALTSGDIHVAKVSGESIVATSGVVRALTSGDIHVAKVSGEIIDLKVPARVTSGGIFVVTGASGGGILTSGPCVSATVKAMTANSGDIHVGGWWLISGQGFVLEPGEAINLDVDNYGRIFLFATVSGDRVTFTGVM